MTDDDPIEPTWVHVDDLEIPVIITKHGIKVKKVPREDKTKTLDNSKK